MTTQLLADPVKFPFSGRTAMNRFEKAAMSERMSSWKLGSPAASGVPSEALIALYKRWAIDGQIGILVTGAIGIFPDYLEAPGNAFIPPDEPSSGLRFDRFKELAIAMKSGGSLAIGQLNQPGRQTASALQTDPISASDVQLVKNELGGDYNKPHPATEGELDTLIKSFVHGAKYLETAGFDGVQLNAAHGYIFSQFLSRTTNHRSDRWGGSLENRARLLLEVVRAIRGACSQNVVLSVKLNCIEFGQDGFVLDEAAEVCRLLEAEKVDHIELSGGTYVEWGWKHATERTVPREGYFMEAADKIRPLLQQSKLYATGGFKTAARMIEGLKTLDGIGLARPLAQDPTLCRDILQGTATGMRAQQIDQTKYALTAVLAGSQMKAISEGYEPADGGKPETAEALMECLKLFMAARGDGPFGEKYGHLALPNLRLEKHLS